MEWVPGKSPFLPLILILETHVIDLVFLPLLNYPCSSVNSVYDACKSVLPNNQDIFCAMGGCQCPLLKKTYRANGLTYKIPRMGGPVFAQILEGNFEGTITFFNNATGREYGCLGMQFPIKSMFAAVTA